MKPGDKNNTLNRRLGYVAAYAVLAFPFQSAAADYTPDSTRYLSDPSYLPLQGQVSGTTTFSFSHINGNTTSTSGAAINSFASNDRIASQLIEYGVTDDISVRELETLGWARIKYHPVTGAEEGAKSDTGPSNPTFGATWRALDQKKYPVSLDLSVDYMPDLLVARNGDFSPVGPKASGGQEVGMGTALSYETRAFTLYGGIDALYTGNRSYYNRANGNDNHYDPNWEYVLNLQTQSRLTNWVALNLGAQEQFYQGYNAVTSNGESYKTTENNITALNAALNFQLVPNRLVAGITYQFDIDGNKSNQFAAPNTANSTNITHEYKNIVGINLNYVFF